LEFFNEAEVSAQGGILRHQFEAKLFSLQDEQLQTVKALQSSTDESPDMDVYHSR